MTTPIEQVESHEETQIRHLIAEQAAAIGAKDLDQLVRLYLPSVVIFDVKPPYRIQGTFGLFRMWDECLPCFPDYFEIETRDLVISVDGNLAIAHWMFRFTCPDENHPATQTYIRCTASYRRVGGKWWIAHEHLSVPFVCVPNSNEFASY